MPKRVFSAMRPTGKLHLGHLLGAIKNWVSLQNTHECVFSIANWHALMGEYENSTGLQGYGIEMALDWIACGIDPQKSILYLQSDVSEHLELQMFLSCLTPLGWLERNPTYKEQLREITTRDLQTYAFLGYPVLQAADILLYKADAVPIGEDQLPHLELCREIARRFNSIYKKEIFPDCKAIMTETPRLLGLDNRKMSKSYDNAINLSDDAALVEKKVVSMITDPQRARKTDPGHPEDCNVYSYYKVFASSQTQEVYHWCTKALKGCVDCKRNLAGHINKELDPIREKRNEIAQDKGKIENILKEGASKAQCLAQNTMKEVRQAVWG
ncbi:MAG: tryptophan--tRNA ligase [Candidatus Omnitrophica bacterium]|nr:tryptophan--tRNA ligase [Candidatus Omnitrophota bacterium]